MHLRAGTSLAQIQLWTKFSLHGSGRHLQETHSAFLGIILHAHIVINSNQQHPWDTICPLANPEHFIYGHKAWRPWHQDNCLNHEVTELSFIFLIFFLVPWLAFFAVCWPGSIWGGKCPHSNEHIPWELRHSPRGWKLRNWIPSNWGGLWIQLSHYLCKCSNQTAININYGQYHHSLLHWCFLTSDHGYCVLCWTQCCQGVLTMLRHLLLEWTPA